MKALINRLKCNSKLENFDEAFSDMKKIEEMAGPIPMVLEIRKKLDEHYKGQTEKKKDEVLGNLKDLGNKLLGNFGISLDNFKMEKNANGSYNI